MSIFGATFKPFVARQIITRQKLISDGTLSSTRSKNIQAYTSGKTSWSRMVSFVDYMGSDTLARKYVLMGGTLLGNPNDANSFGLRHGLATPNGAYGSNLGDRSQGYRPMPGITGVSLTNMSAFGSLRRATITFKAWDKTQLDNLELLYMRTGFPVLLEWGWSMYMDTSTSEDKDYTTPNTSGVSGIKDAEIATFLNKNIKTFSDPIINPFNGQSQYDIYDNILKLNYKFSGNYDGMLGFIENFSWELEKDGSYNCTTVLISIGDTLDSIKMNRPAIISDKDKRDNAAYKTNFGQLIEDLLYHEDPKTKQLVNNIGAAPVSSRPYQQDVATFKQVIKDQYQSTVPQGLVIDLPVKYVQDTTNFDLAIQPLVGYMNGIPSDAQPNAKGQLSEPSYIQLALFIAILKEKFNLFDDKKNPLLHIEVPVYDPTNSYKNMGNGLCLGSVDSVSVDPRVCIIQNKNATWVTGSPTGCAFDGITLKEFLINDKKDKYMGVIGNIYLNLQHIADKFNDMLSHSENGEVHIYKFIKSILDDVSIALGSINEFDVFVTDNRAVIIDRHYTELSSNSAKAKKFTLNVFGNNTVTRGFRILSKIFQSQASMIAIAAGAGNRMNLGGVNDSTQAYMMKNLSNRLLGPLKLEENKGNTDEDAEIIKEKKNLAQNLLSIRKYLSDFIVGHAFPANPESIPAAATILNSILLNINFDVNYRAVIPINAEITMDGIAGITMGEVFMLNTDVLPEDYKRSDMGFMVTAIKHDVMNSDWTTTFGAYPILLDQENKKDDVVVNKMEIEYFANLQKGKNVEDANNYILQYWILLYVIKYYYENNLQYNYKTSVLGSTTPVNDAYYSFNLNQILLTFMGVLVSDPPDKQIGGTYDRPIKISDIQAVLTSGTAGKGFFAKYPEFSDHTLDTHTTIGVYTGTTGKIDHDYLLNPFFRASESSVPVGSPDILEPLKSIITGYKEFDLLPQQLKDDLVAQATMVYDDAVNIKDKTVIPIVYLIPLSPTAPDVSGVVGYAVDGGKIGRIPVKYTGNIKKIIHVLSTQ